MIKLYGAALSPYYNKVKIALLEKGVNFQEILTAPSQQEELLAKSPMGKIPFVEVGGHAMAESSVILEWLEDAYPTASLLPPTPNGRAHARQLSAILDLYVLMPALPLYRHWLFGSPLEANAVDTARQQVARGLAAAGQMLDYGPWACGEDFSHADISAACILPALAQMSQALLGEDITAAFPERDSYLQQLSARKSVNRCWSEREAALSAFRARQQQ
ncbi:MULTISPECIES: glutathione S-transferase family protein [Chromobacterium]|uniref:Glutathione S-transferase family protein n=1 Tax=Chromobacterium aquaticum TaxID=467180 RepID=A0ABV8ZVG9_9NEIS|nr:MULTISPECIES: glutathione S-transferase family protein [Chromobacterium]KMN37558.1 glutathione transferase [Chromobacterium sp. LK1]MCD5361359.1 glutathione S-transferase family protein [Chromobacterium aquaticum]